MGKRDGRRHSTPGLSKKVVVAETRVAYHLQKRFSENPFEKLMEHEFLGRSGEKFPGATAHLKR